MAQKQQTKTTRLTTKIIFRDIQLLKKETLGVGSYGSVFKAKCDGLLCAAKIIHPTLVPLNAHEQISPQREHRLPIRRFETECEFLKEIRHPNIIQFLGMYQDPETGLPVLLMELMDESLTHFLEKSTEDIACHIQMKICTEVIRALYFLHLNGIIHRDLSSNNILLTGGEKKAKLTDFGMAKLINLQCMSRISNTMCPGTEVYMPPEAIDNQAVYTEKGDVFSFGVNMIQILTREFPKPGDRFKTLPINDRRFPSGRVEARASEVERRQNHISKINPSHPILPIALNCLKDQQSERPSAGDLCQTLAILRDSSESVTATVNRQQKIVSQMHVELFNQIDHYRQVIAGKQQEINDLKEKQNTSQATVTNELSAFKEREYKELIAKQQKHIDELELRYKKLKAQQSTPPDTPINTQPKKLSVSEPPVQHKQSAKKVKELKCKPGSNAPCKMYRSTDAVVSDNIAYFKPGGLTRNVFAFNYTTDTWFQLPDCPTEFTTLAVVDNILTTIGGVHCNQLFSFIEENEEKKWKELLPPMVTKRSNTIAISTGRFLIVVGGEGEGGTLRTVEIMNIDKCQWYIAADLPQPLSLASATVCGDRLYMSGHKTVITCSVRVLLQPCQTKSLLDKIFSTSHKQTWSTVAEFPFHFSNLVSVNNCLLAIGGRDSKYDSTTAISMYDPVYNSWQTVGHLKTPRWWCFATLLPSQTIMVAGGFTLRWGKETNTVEFVEVD